MDLLWLTRHTDTKAARRRGENKVSPENAAFKLTLTAGRQKGGASALVRALLAVNIARPTEETFNRVSLKFSTKDAAVVAALTEVAVATSRTTLACSGETASRPHKTSRTQQRPSTCSNAVMCYWWRATTGCASSTSRALSTSSSPRRVRQHRRLWRRIVRIMDDPTAFPPKLLQILLQSNLMALTEKFYLISVGSTVRRMLKAEVLRQWKPKLR